MYRLILILCLSIIPCFPASAADKGPKNQTGYTDPVTGMQFVSIPGGSFVMGHEYEVWGQPVHRVTVQPFYLGRFEVTFTQYDLFCEETGRQKPKDEGWGRTIRPVIHVSWDDAVAFADWLSAKTGRTFRLPSEAEWEYAARSGTITRFAWGNDLGRGNANCENCGSPWDGTKTTVVGTFTPNQFGLFDMAGNVYEWCLDVWHENYDGAPTDGSAWVEGERPNLKVTRGGSWRQPPTEVTTSKRCYHNHTNTRAEVGFRLVMEP